jgi:trehalose 6-phosphate synthase
MGEQRRITTGQWFLTKLDVITTIANVVQSFQLMNASTVQYWLYSVMKFVSAGFDRASPARKPGKQQSGGTFPGLQRNLVPSKFNTEQRKETKIPRIESLTTARRSIGVPMRFFHLRLLGSLLLGIIGISVASTYFDVLAHNHALRHDLQLRTQWFAKGLQTQLDSQMASLPPKELEELLLRLRTFVDQPGVAVYDMTGALIASAGDVYPLKTLSPTVLNRSLAEEKETAAYVRVPDDTDLTQSAEGQLPAARTGSTPSTQLWFEDVLPLNAGGHQAGAVALVANASFIRAEGMEVWKRSFLRIAALVVLIVIVTLVMVRWLLVQPLLQAAEWLRRVRQGKAGIADGEKELSFLSPIAKEITSIAVNLTRARAAAESEARLRDAGERVWTADRLAVHVAERLGGSRLFVVSNREPYMHVRQGKETACIVPPSGVVTAIEPILQACDGTWIAHGSGNEDMAFVEDGDRLRIPPEDPRYTLRRVWLSDEEVAGYYEGFSNEGLWPLCHIAHTRPIFRIADWEYYQRVNERFAEVLAEEMRDQECPVVFVQDYHFAMLPQMIKDIRPDARVAIFWHIPWPNPEAFAICPWQAELLTGMLGADIIGFHVQAHCNNFLDTVDRVLESRTDWEHFTVRRFGHLSSVRAFPISVAWDEAKSEHPSKSESNRLSYMDRVKISLSARTILGYDSLDDRHFGKLHKELGILGQHLILGVDRMDYTKGIVERLSAIECLLEEHPQFIENLTFVQIAAPSRSRIPAYAALGDQVREAATQINRRFGNQRWEPIRIIERQCSHEEIKRYYEAADICVVTSLHDGMNMVSKEYIAARSDGDGVLVLSRFAGAAQELRDSLIVNPYDIGQVAGAIRFGLEMAVSERRLRMSRMRVHVKEHNVYRWAANILSDLCSVRLEDHEMVSQSEEKENQMA